MKKLENKKMLKIIIATLVSVVVLSIAVFVVIRFVTSNNDNSENQPKSYINYKEDLTYEINQEITLNDLIDNYENIEIYDLDTKIDTSALGEKTIEVKYKNLIEEVENTNNIEITIIDKTNPILNLKQNEISINKGENINLLEYVECTDNSNEEITIEIEGDYDVNTVGTYSIRFLGKDSSGNTGYTENINLTVKEIANEQQTSNKTTNNNSTTNKNNSSNTTSTTSKPSTTTTTTEPEKTTTETKDPYPRTLCNGKVWRV